MQSNFIKKIQIQKKIPIIGSGGPNDIFNKVDTLVAKEFKIIEITLRSDSALETSIEVKKQYPNLIIGLGSIQSISQLQEVSKYNFNFYISPGINEKMLDFSNTNNLNFIPGISTPSEIMKGIEYNYKVLKFFHSEKNGGTSTLKFFNEIFRDILFIPTGGINNDNCNSYLQENNVLAVGSTSF
jgi:2-dehydro-3-deoxyphosphogluconate aldolase/(4S)-4-hydroxy-2-oxoglutarate aldolase|tara:strand:- start:169 stop:720 length:552 start_codon:yes stop_codon:yes gene_type:complete